MSDGCTNCGNKGGCDHRKGAMFGAIDEALARLYPTRSFAERDDTGAAGPGDSVAEALAPKLAERLKSLALVLPPSPEEYCRHIYVLCFGRQPSLVEALHGGPRPAREDFAAGPIEELHLRVSVSDLAPFAAVQQVRLRGELGGDELVIEEAPRTGVFDPVLLARMQAAVAVIVGHGLIHLDFGDISAPPAGFDPGDYAERFGGAPAVANYLFYPQPPSSITTTVVPFVT